MLIYTQISIELTVIIIRHRADEAGGIPTLHNSYMLSMCINMLASSCGLSRQTVRMAYINRTRIQ